MSLLNHWKLVSHPTLPLKLFFKQTLMSFLELAVDTSQLFIFVSLSVVYDHFLFDVVISLAFFINFWLSLHHQVFRFSNDRALGFNGRPTFPQT